MLRYGKISEVDPSKGYARVTFLDDGIVSDWLQIVVLGALSNKFFHTPDVNEQVACLMDEHSEDGVILGATWNDGSTPPEGVTADQVGVLFPDGTRIQYDRSSHEYTIDVKGPVSIKSTGTVSVEAQVVSVDAEQVSVEASNVNITGNTIVTGNLTVSGTASAAALSAPVISGPGVTMEAGNLEADGELKGATVTDGTVDLGTHKHGGVQTGGGQTSPPV